MSVYSTPYTTYRVRIVVKNNHYNAGSWPSKQEAERVHRIALDTARELHARGLSPEQIQRQLNGITGLNVKNAPKIPVLNIEGVDGKTCKDCDLWKPLDKFRKCERWVGNTCHVCHEQRRSSESYARKIARNIARAKANPEIKKAQNRAYYSKNREKIIAQTKRYWREHPEIRLKKKESNKIWNRQNREKCIAALNNYRARKAGGGGSFSSAEWRALCERYGNVCLCCQRRVKLTADHVLPVSLGGSSDISNIQPLCQSCNSRKRNQHIDYRP